MRFTDSSRTAAARLPIEYGSTQCDFLQGMLGTNGFEDVGAIDALVSDLLALRRN